VSEDLEVDKQSSRRLYEEVFGRGNYAVADEILTADVISHGPGVSPVVGTDPIKRQAALLRSAFPDLQVVLGDQLAEGDRVSTRWSASGTHTGPLNLPPAQSSRPAPRSRLTRCVLTAMSAVGSWRRGFYPIA
jgi:predicted SnoaL-like aldol condensation-catalyzing enzyme